MGYKIDYKKLIKLRNKLDELLNELETDAKNLTILSEYMYDSCSINCKAARSVKAYIKDVHISAISPYILNAIDVVRTITTEYFYEMYEIDNGEDSVIQEEHLENLEGKLYGLKNKACEILFELEKYAEAISDIMDVTTKNAEELEPYFDEQKLIVTKLKKEFALYESEKLEEAKAAQQVINGFYTKVSNYGNDNLDITQYDGEYYIEPLPTEGLPEVEQLYDELGYNDEENAIDTLGEVGGIMNNTIDGAKYHNGKYTGGRTKDELDDLAKDPSHAYRIELQGLKEREIGLDLEERGELGYIIRDDEQNGGAEFIDVTTGIKWDIKSFESYPNGHTDPKKGAFTVSNAMKKINKEFDKNHNVIIDVRELTPEHIEELKDAIEREGVSDRIIWYP